jgi:hypothetical protein
MKTYPYHEILRRCRERQARKLRNGQDGDDKPHRPQTVRVRQPIKQHSGRKMKSVE